MNILKGLFIITAAFIAIPAAHTQTTEAEKQLTEQNADSLAGWKKGGTINISTSQTSLTNWAAGGQSSVSVNGLLSVYSDYQKNKALWENTLDLGYGNMRQSKKTGWRKTDDKIDFTSKIGFRATENLYYAALLNFKTQMASGYNYPDDSTVISKFLAPGYLLGGLGIDYKPSEYFAAFIAPLTLKTTFVNDKDLSDAGAFGVEPGKKTYGEFGGYMRFSLKKAVMENIMLQTKLDLFSNYLNKPQNIDVNWETLLSMKVNKYISASLSTHLIYDDDIDIAVDKNDDGIIDETGPRLQFKEVLAVGLSIIF
ncbi:MAG: DUF3078 domain-containing protein [Bacteroidales bacterium]|nr:DUF3078 domain-containing protein [Bacteroidales bacterium]